jgi:eukaryotic-like serine/threonine-protein kinase
MIGGALLSALIAGVVGSVAALILAHRERDRAEGSFRQARQAVDHFFTRVSHEKLLNQPGLHPLRKALLADAQGFYEEFLRKRSGDRSIGPELALARTHLAQITSVTGSATEAISQFQHAITLWEGLVATQPANAAYREALAQALNEQGAVILHTKGQLDEALRIFRRASDLLEPHAAASHSTAASHELSLILLNMGEAQREQDQLTEAIGSIERSLAIEEELVTKNPDLLDSSISMAKGHALLGQIFMGEPDGMGPAQKEYQQAIQLLEKVSKLHPDLSDQAFELAFVHNDLSHLHQMAGKLDSALGSALKALEILERLERQYPSALNYQEGLAGIYQLMSDLHHRRREPAEALMFAQKAQALLGRLVELHPENVNLRLDLAKSQNNLGRMFQQIGEPVDALRSFQRAIDLYESMPDLDSRSSYLLACNIALCIRLIGVKNGSEDTVALSKLSKADLLRRERYSDRAVELLRRVVGDGLLDIDVLQSDTDLDSLRDRPDFQRLLDEIDGKMTGDKK